jgi:hypothetical protein
VNFSSIGFAAQVLDREFTAAQRGEIRDLARGQPVEKRDDGVGFVGAEQFVVFPFHEHPVGRRGGAGDHGVHPCAQRGQVGGRHLVPEDGELVAQRDPVEPGPDIVGQVWLASVSASAVRRCARQAGCSSAARGSSPSQVPKLLRLKRMPPTRRSSGNFWKNSKALPVTSSKSTLVRPSLRLPMPRACSDQMAVATDQGRARRRLGRQRQKPEEQKGGNEFFHREIK